MVSHSERGFISEEPSWNLLKIFELFKKLIIFENNSDLSCGVDLRVAFIMHVFIRGMDAENSFLRLSISRELCPINGFVFNFTTINYLSIDPLGIKRNLFQRVQKVASVNCDW